MSEGWLAIRSSLTFQAGAGWYRYGVLRKVGSSDSLGWQHECGAAFFAQSGGLCGDRVLTNAVDLGESAIERLYQFT